MRLTEEGGSRTRLELEHIAHDDMWEQYGPGATGIGWDSILLGPAGHLSPGAASPPEESAAWIASEEGRLFTTLSSERWCEASNAADTDEAAAERVLAAHTARE